jgi:hypothetical protein
MARRKTLLNIEKCLQVDTNLIFSNRGAGTGGHVPPSPNFLKEQKCPVSCKIRNLLEVLMYLKTIWSNDWKFFLVPIPQSPTFLGAFFIIQKRPSKPVPSPPPNLLMLPTPLFINLLVTVNQTMIHDNI